MGRRWQWHKPGESADRWFDAGFPQALVRYQPLSRNLQRKIWCPNLGDVLEVRLSMVHHYFDGGLLLICQLMPSRKSDRNNTSIINLSIIKVYWKWRGRMLCICYLVGVIIIIITGEWMWTLCCITCHVGLVNSNGTAHYSSACESRRDIRAICLRQ